MLSGLRSSMLRSVGIEDLYKKVDLVARMKILSRPISVHGFNLEAPGFPSCLWQGTAHRSLHIQLEFLHELDSELLLFDYVQLLQAEHV